MEDFVKNLPKAELHLHLDGTIAPESWKKLADKNGMEFPFKDVPDCWKHFEFTGLQTFVDMYDLATEVVLEGDDLYQVAFDYLEHCNGISVRHVEFAWAPELYCFRETNAITVGQQLEGINRAFAEAKEKFNMTALLILTFIRHKPTDTCYKVLELTEPYKDQIAGVGLAGYEQGFGAELFQDVFKVSKEKYGYKATAHAGEITNAKAVKDTIDLLKVDRVDHGVQAMHDEELLQRIADTKMHLTVCPISNVLLKVFSDIEEVPVRLFYDRGVHFSINSDDPPFFNASLLTNY